MVHETKAEHAAHEAHAGKGTGFYRVHVWAASAPSPTDVDHVVAAKDEAEAEAKGFAEIGIIAVDKANVRVEIGTASELEYLTAQAKRLGVNLRSAHDADGKLTWAPPEHAPKKQYWVSKTGEIVDKKEEE